MVAAFLHFYRLLGSLSSWAIVECGSTWTWGGGTGKTWWGAMQWTCSSSLRHPLVLSPLTLEGIWMLWCCDGWLKYCLIDFKIFQWLLLKISQRIHSGRTWEISCWNANFLMFHIYQAVLLLLFSLTLVMYCIFIFFQSTDPHPSQPFYLFR